MRSSKDASKPDTITTPIDRRHASKKISVNCIQLCSILVSVTTTWDHQCLPAQSPKGQKRKEKYLYNFALNKGLFSDKRTNIKDKYMFSKWNLNQLTCVVEFGSSRPFVSRNSFGMRRWKFYRQQFCVRATAYMQKGPFLFVFKNSRMLKIAIFEKMVESRQLFENSSCY